MAVPFDITDFRLFVNVAEKRRLVIPGGYL
jgi:hypothetical protein